MSRIGELLAVKGGGAVHTIRPSATVFEAVSRMVENNVGALLVTDDSNHVAGIITERDYLRRIAVEGRTSKTTLVEEIMSHPVVYVSADTGLEEAMAVMTERRIRHLPVMAGEILEGIVSIGDLVKFQSHQRAHQIKYLTDYITAR